MSSADHPNITALNKLYLKHKASVDVSPSILLCDRPDYRRVSLTISNRLFTLFVDDEYEDFKYNYPLLNFCLVLRELEDYKDADDFLMWCAERHFDASDRKLKDYFIDLGNTFTEIESILGGINSFIPNMDFELSMGEVYILRSENWNY